MKLIARNNKKKINAKNPKLVGKQPRRENGLLVITLLVKEFSFIYI